MNNANLTTKTINPNFEKFYKGWFNFLGINVQPDMVIFTLPNPKYAEDSYLKAQQRINELCLPLTAERTGKFSNTFIIKEANNA